jgi:hypothetical protein
MTRPLDRVRHEASRIWLAFLIFRDSRGVRNRDPGVIRPP